MITGIVVRKILMKFMISHSYPDDFDDTDGNSRGRGTAHKSGLNP